MPLVINFYKKGTRVLLKLKLEKIFTLEFFVENLKC